MANDATPYDEPRKLERLDILAKQRKADTDTLTTADWVDATKGTVRIPINEAIPEEIATLKAKPVQMGAEIPGAAPKPATAAVATTTPTTNAPAGAPTAPTTNAAPAAPPTPAPAAPNK